MKPNKNSMLVDVQYIKENKKNKQPDVLYLIYKDLDTGEKYLSTTEKPSIDIYFKKPECRDYTNHWNYATIDTLYKKRVRYSAIPFAIAEEAGEDGKRFINSLRNTGNWRDLNKIQSWPYVFGSDFDIRAWYRLEWLQRLDNSAPKPLKKGQMDIEVDGLGKRGMPTADQCPINLITYIDDDSNTSFTFVNTEHIEYQEINDDLPKREFKRRTRINQMIDKHESRVKEMMDDPEMVQQYLHDLFDESYPGMTYKIFYFNNELKMIKYVFALINQLKPDFVQIWNIAFDIPYIIDRIRVLGEDPAEIICHPDFKYKQCWFKEDKRNFAVKNNSSFFFASSYTIFTCQMRNYAAIRKGGKELRSFTLNYVGEKEVRDVKLDYSEAGNVSEAAYNDFLMFMAYNIKDVLLQKAIEDKTEDLDTIYVRSYSNATPVDSIFKQTVMLRNVQYHYFMQQNIVPGTNINQFMTDQQDDVIELNPSDDDDEVGFEGALVADPVLNDYVGLSLYGKLTNNIFKLVIDMDMAAFYPNTIIALNIDGSTLIFKAIVPAKQFRNGDMKLYRMPGELDDDAAKELFDNYLTGSPIQFCRKWLNLRGVEDMEFRIGEKIRKIVS